jgi:hypothetical protein
MKGESTMTRQLMRSIKLMSAALLIGITLALPNAKADSPKLPPGIYATTITESDVPPYFPPEVIEILVGEWRTEFTDGGTYIVTKEGEIVVVGRYTSNRDRFVMTDLQGAYACTDAPGIATGVYRWSLENNELVLVPVLDRCDGRKLALTSHPLQKL